MADPIESRGLWRMAFVTVGGVLIVAGLCAGVPRFVRWNFAPPGNAKTFAEFVAQEPKKTRLWKIQHQERAFYVWHGDVIMLAAPSGPSCFVFDARGELVAFTATTGDGELGEYCDIGKNASPVDIHDVLAELER